MDTEETVQVCQLPRRPRGGYAAQKFHSVDITTNFYQVSTAPISTIYIWKLRITPNIPLDDRTTRTSVLERAGSDIRSHIRNCAFMQQTLCTVVGTFTP